MNGKLRLAREALADLAPADLAALAGAAATPLCPPESNGCPWTGNPCLLTGTPPSYRICS